MKYLLMIYQNPATWQTLPETTKQELMSEAGAIVDELIESGEWGRRRGTRRRCDKSVRVRDGVPA